jgi:hypothetical protein
MSLYGEFEPSTANDTTECEVEPAGVNSYLLIILHKLDSIQHNSDFAQCQLALSASQCVMAEHSGEGEAQIIY